MCVVLPVRLFLDEFLVRFWNQVYPESFYDNFPTVTLNPSSSEHDARDFGGATLGIAVVLGIALLAPRSAFTIPADPGRPAAPACRSHPAWGAVLLGGPALFVAGRLRLEQSVFGRVSPHRPVALLTLLVLSAPLLFAPPLVTAVAVAAVLAAVVLIHARNAQRRPTESAAPGDTRA